MATNGNPPPGGNPPPDANPSNDGNRPVERPRQRRRMVTRSPIWEHYTRLENDRSMCNYCGFEVGCNSKTDGTSPMLNHNKSCKMFLDSKDSDKQNVIGKDISGNMKTIRYCPETFRKSVIQMVVLNELPFSFVESAGFKLFVANVVPFYKTFSRRTACREIVSMYMSEKSMLKKMFSESKKRVSLTTDIWVAPTTSYNYMVVTAHWIDDDWCMQKRIISFKPIYDHKGETIASQLIESLEEWGIEKVFTITVDNARNNDRALTVFREKFTGKYGADALVQGGQYLHMRCCAHILNLVVKDGLSKQNDSIVKVRNGVKYVRSSFARLKSFELRTEAGTLGRGALILDCITRWNSTYLMLYSALKLKEAFSRMVTEDKLFCDYFLEEDEKGKRRIGPPSDADWEDISMLVKFLKIFFKTTVVFSASKTVTSTLCYNEIVTIERNLLARSFSDDDRVREQAHSMREKFERYWDGLLNMNPLVIIASVFDPRNKMQFANLCFEKLYGDGLDFGRIQAVVNNALKLLFNEYNTKYGASRSDGPSSSDGANLDEDAGGCDLMEFSDEDNNEYERMDSIYAQMVKERTHEASATELEIYLMEKTEIRVKNPLGLEYDVLSWWKHNARKFPVLSQLAKDVLAMQVSSVASESAFSTSGRILDPYRSSLTPFMIEALVCGQQWLRVKVAAQEQAGDRVQNLVQMAEEIGFLESLDPRVKED